MKLLRFSNRTTERGAAGSVSIISPVAILSICAAAAFAVDLGHFAFHKRRVQSAADLAAIAAASNLSDAENAARAALVENGFDAGALIALTIGRYEPDETLSPELRFAPAQDVEHANAARVSVRDAAPYFFGALLSALIPSEAPDASIAEDVQQTDGLPISAHAVAARSAAASLGIGSRLLSLRGGVANAILGEMLGVNVELSVMDYRALARARVDMFSFSEALARELNVEAGTYSSILSTEVPLDAAIAALGLGLSGQDASDRTARRALRLLRNAGALSSEGVDLTALISFGPYSARNLGDRPALRAEASALSVLSAIAQIANGERMVELDLDVDLPPIARSSVRLMIGERPQWSSWMTIGSRGAEVSTSQLRLEAIFEIDAAAPLASIQLPLYLEIANGSARIADLSCAGGGAVEIDAVVSPAEAWIGMARSRRAAHSRFGRPFVEPARIASIGSVSLTAWAHVQTASDEAQRVTIRRRQIESGEPTTVRSRGFAGALIHTLLDDVELQTRPHVIGVAVPSLGAQTLRAVEAPLDAFIDELLEALGIGLGEADIFVGGIDCRAARLVQ